MSLAKESGLYLSVGLDDSPFQKDMKAFMLTAQRAGDTASKAFDGAFTPNKISSSFTNLAKSINTASAAASHLNTSIKVSGLDALAKSAGLSASGLDKMYEAAIKVARDSSLERAFANIQKQTGMSTLGMAKFRYELGDTSGALSTLASGAKANAVGILAFGAAAAMAGKQVLDATLQMDRLNKAYGSITGSSAAAQSQLDYIYDVTQRLGLQFQGTAEAAKGFFAAGKESPIKDQLNGVFESVSMAGSALALSKDQMDGVFLALGQMISKGKVQAEELRGQLGERLPGAFDAAARAMGVTTAKLDDMLKKGQVTAEEMLPKLAKVLHDDFAIAAAEASQGLQAQLNRLSTEWTRFQSSLLNGDAAAKVMGQLASGMKVLADHGAELAAIVGKGIQWAAWTAGVYAAIKALSGLSTAVTAAKAAIAAFNVSSVAAAVGSLSGLLGPAGLAAAAGAAIVAFTSLSSSTQSADDIFRKHQATIDDYKEKMGKATDAVKTFSEEQEKAYRKSLERQRDVLKTDIADALKGVNSHLDDVSIFGAGIAKAPLIQEAKEAVEELGRELAKLGQNVTQDDLNAYAEKVWAIDERMRGAGLATKEWNDMITNLVGEGDSFVLKLAAMIAKSLEIEGTLERLRLTAADAKGELATGWMLNVDNVTEGIAKMENSIRGMKAEMLGFKSSKVLVDLLPGLSPEEIKAANDAFGKNGLEGALRAVGDAANDWGVAQRLAFNDLLETSNTLDDQEKKLEAWRKSQQTASKSAASSVINLDELRKSVEALEAANIPAAKSFDQMAEKIREQSKQTQIAIEADAARMVATKKLTVAQAEEWKGLKFREDAAKTTQKLAEVEAKRGEQDKKYADLRLDFEKRYADMVGLSSEAVSKSISKQAEEYRKAIEAGENAAEELVRLEEWKRDQIQRASREAMDGAQVALRDYQVEASNQAKSMNDAFRGLFSGMDSGWKSAWEQMIETGKVSLSSFRSLFASFLADLMHMAITRPITVQIAGAVSGMLGTGGVAYAAGGAGASGGGITDILSMGTSFLPGGSVTGMINEAAAWAAPSLFSTTSGYMEAAGTELLKAGVTGTAPAATPAPGTFTSAFGAPALGASIGSFASPYVNNLLGLQNNKGSQIGSMVGGLGTTAVLGTMAATNFWNPAGWVAAGLAALGSISGGSIGSLFGGGRKTHASVYGHMMGLGYTTDTQTYIDAFMEQATYDRAGKTEASGYAQVIGEAASQTAGNILDLAAMLPEAYKQSVEEQLASATWSAGRGYSGASWNLQNWKEGMAEERIQEAIDDMFEQMGYGANKAFAEAGIGELFDSFDLSTEEGFKKAQTALSAISSITTAIDEITSPATEAEKQAQAFVEQMNALGEAVKASGLNAAYADEMIGEYRTAYVDKYVETLEEMFNPLSQIEQQAKGYKTAIDGYVAALTTMQASEEQLAQVRGYTQDAIDSITGSLDAAFFPLSDVEQQTKATMESLLAYKAALETLGASAEELTHIDAAWGKMQSDLLDKARDYVRTTPQIVSQSAAMNAEFDALREAMLLAGNATADLTELERTRAQAVAALQAQYAESFRQTYAQRYATLTGDTNGLANLQQQASFSSELAEIEKTWGKDSLQYKQMQALQEAEAAKLRLEQAQAAADKLAQLQLEHEKLVMQTSVDSSKARLDAFKVEKSAAEKLKSAWEDVLTTIYKTRLNMYQSDDNLDLFGRLATAQGEFDRLYGLAIGGDADAAKEMASVSSSLLDLRKETSATSADYLDAFYGVDKKLKDVSGIADKQVSAADRQLAVLGSQLSVQEAQYGVLSAQLSALGSQNSTLASIDAQIAGLKGVLSGLDSAKGDYQSALDKVNGIKPNTGVYGSNYLTEYDLLVAKVASLNRGEYIDPNFGIPAGGWTIANARQAMLDTYGSVTEWYKNAGKIEGFAKGGLASGWGIAGEYGPELIDFSTPGRVYTAEQTRQILMPPAVGTDGSLVAEIAKLREQNKEMARELRIANARLEKMEKYAKETKDGVDEIRVVGIPVTVEA